VTGGTLMTSANYRLLVVSGESLGLNGVSTSAKYRLVGGVVGTTQP
jgi:hypothetical protein